MDEEFVFEKRVLRHGSLLSFECIQHEMRTNQDNEIGKSVAGNKDSVEDEDKRITGVVVSEESQMVSAEVHFFLSLDHST